MNDDELTTLLRERLQAIYPEPDDVSINVRPIGAPAPIGRRLQMFLAIAAIAVVTAAAVALTHNSRNESDNQAGVTPSAARTSSAVRPTPKLTIPRPEPVISGDRLIRPFSISGGQIQLVPLPAGYQPKVTAARAAAIITDFGSPLYPIDVKQPPLFLASLTDYGRSTRLDPSTGALIPDVRARPVWVSLVYVQQQLYGPPGTPASRVPGDEITTLSADTGQVLSGINVASPDPTPSTVAQVVTSTPRK